MENLLGFIVAGVALLILFPEAALYVVLMGAACLVVYVVTRFLGAPPMEVNVGWHSLVALVLVAGVIALFLLLQPAVTTQGGGGVQQETINSTNWSDPYGGYR